MAAAADSSPLLASSPTKCLWGEGGECGGEGKRKRDKYGKRRVCACVCGGGNVQLRLPPTHPLILANPAHRVVPNFSLNG